MSATDKSASGVTWYCTLTLKIVNSYVMQTILTYDVKQGEHNIEVEISVTKF